MHANSGGAEVDSKQVVGTLRVRTCGLYTGRQSSGRRQHRAEQRVTRGACLVLVLSSSDGVGRTLVNGESPVINRSSDPQSEVHGIIKSTE